MNNQQHQPFVNQQDFSPPIQQHKERNPVVIVYGEPEAKKTLNSGKGLAITLNILFLGYMGHGVIAFLGIRALTMSTDNVFLSGAELFISYIGVWGTIVALYFIGFNPLRLVHLIFFNHVWWRSLQETTPLNILLYSFNLFIDLFVIVLFIMLLSTFEHLTGCDTIVNNKPISQAYIELSYHNLNSWHNIEKIVESEGKVISTQSYVGGWIGINLIDLVGSHYEIMEINGKQVRIYSPIMAIIYLFVISLLLLIFWMQKQGIIDLYEMFIKLESKKKA